MCLCWLQEYVIENGGIHLKILMSRLQGASRSNAQEYNMMQSLSQTLFRILRTFSDI